MAHGSHSSSGSSSSRSKQRENSTFGAARIHWNFKARVEERERAAAACEREKSRALTKRKRETNERMPYSLVWTQMIATYSVQFYAFQFKTSKINYIKFLFSFFFVCWFVHVLCYLFVYPQNGTLHIVVFVRFVCLIPGARIFTVQRECIHSNLHPKSKSL